MVGLLGEKFTFFNSLGTTKISRRLRIAVYVNVVLLVNCPEQFELCFYFKYSRSSIKFIIQVTKLLKQDLEALISTNTWGLVPTFFGITTKQRLLLGYACEIPHCDCRARTFSAKSELRVTQLTLKWEKMTKSSERSNDHSFLELRAL